MASLEDKEVTVTKSKEDNEKGEVEHGSSNSSEAGSPTDQDKDLEKAAPVKAKSVDEIPDPSDPNVVDWEGSDDPENPQNW